MAGETRQNVNFVMASAVITGTIKDATTTDGIPNAWVEVYRPNGGGLATIASADTSGAFNVPLGAGTYYVVARTATQGYVDQVYPEAYCSPNCTLARGSVVTVSAGQILSNIDFSLVKGGTITGTVKDAGTDVGIPNTVVIVLDSDGRDLGGRASDASGLYRVDSLLPGDYYLRTYQASDQGYLDQVFDRIVCDPYCDVWRGTKITVSGGQTVSGVTFALTKPGPPPNTPPGTGVLVSPTDPVTASQPVTLGFEVVTTAGASEVTSSATGPTPPANFSLVGDYYAVSTTARFSGVVTVCITYPVPMPEGVTESALVVQHFNQGTDAWEPLLTTVDATHHVACGQSTSLSPFAVFARKPLYQVVPLYDQEKAKQSGSTYPIRLLLNDANGADVSSGDLIVTAVGASLISEAVTGPVATLGNANPDANFRFSDGRYIFNLSTDGLASGTYLLHFRCGSDPTDYTVQFQVR